MRLLQVEHITRHVSEMCQEANYYLDSLLEKKIKEAIQLEESPCGREVLRQLGENARIAREEKVPLCQDTGFSVVFLELGQEVYLQGGDLEEAVNRGVRKGYREGYLRNSIVRDPLQRDNTGDNTPCIFHVRIVPGDRVKIIVAPKGGGSENASALKMLRPADGEQGIIDFVLEVVEKAGPGACPPLVVGVGLGGSFDSCPLLAKKALLRPVGGGNPQAYYRRLERLLLDRVNRSGIGPQGYGGRVTALAVHIEVFPTHIACLPAAVNLNCHSSRSVERVI